MFICGCLNDGGQAATQGWQGGRQRVIKIAGADRYLGVLLKVSGD